MPPRFGSQTVAAGAILLAALALVAMVLKVNFLIVLVGTLYPMIYGLLGWGRLSVGAPYFNRATLPFGLLMLVVIVLATFVSGKRVQLPALVAHAGVLLFAAGAWSPASAVRRSA